jgi:hypothetical protein
MLNGDGAERTLVTWNVTEIPEDIRKTAKTLHEVLRATWGQLLSPALNQDRLRTLGQYIDNLQPKVRACINAPSMLAFKCRIHLHIHCECFGEDIVGRPPFPVLSMWTKQDIGASSIKRCDHVAVHFAIKWRILCTCISSSRKL